MKALEQKIEALLFYKNEPLRFRFLSQKLNEPEETIRNTINAMSHYYEGRGMELVITSESVVLMTHKDVADLIQEVSHSKGDKELSKQALETLSIIAYKGAVTKNEIDYIRGVNSVFILRNLLIRGLIEKKSNLDDKRSPLYVPTHDFFAYLGITQYSELPEFEKTQKLLTEFHQNFLEE